MEIKIFNKGFNYNQDGPGNRLIYYLQGCNLRCPWCSNPEGMSINGTMLVFKEKLLNSVCPYGAIYDKQLLREKCVSCSQDCIAKLRNEGIRCSYKSVSVKEIVEEVKSVSILFYNGGGITLSGGEPTMQYGGIFKILSSLRECGINTALETNGTNLKLPGLFPYIDTLIVDIKHYKESEYNYLKGSFKNVLENINKAAEASVNLWLRITLIPGFNDSPYDIERFIEIIRPIPQLYISVELLLYHEYSLMKWEQCGYKYDFKGGKIAEKTRKNYEEQMIKAGIKIQRT